MKFNLLVIMYTALIFFNRHLVNIYINLTFLYYFIWFIDWKQVLNQLYNQDVDELIVKFLYKNMLK